MGLIGNKRGLGSLSLLILLVASAIFGGLLSYLWVTGYYEFLNIQVGPALSITDAHFSDQNTRSFNVTVLHPTHSNITGDAHIRQITVSTVSDGIVHNVTTVVPSLATPLPKGESQNFRCSWNWANYTGVTVRIDVSVTEESGGSREFQTPLVDLRVVAVDFNATVSVTQFNVTVESGTASETYVNVTKVAVVANGIEQNVTIITPTPWTIESGETQVFTCDWNWLGYPNTDATIVVHTLQGYRVDSVQATPFPPTLDATDIIFDVADTSQFQVNITCTSASPIHVTIGGITVAIGNVTLQQWTVENGTQLEPALPYMLNSNTSVTLMCPWDWTNYRDQSVTVIIDTLQGLPAERTEDTPPLTTLEFIQVSFDPMDVLHFDITVKNSEYSPEASSITITGINVMIAGQVVADLTGDVTPSLPLTLTWNESSMLDCTWSWSMYAGEKATVMVWTTGGYSFHSDQVTLVALEITEVVFNTVDMGNFLLTVKNPESLLSSVDITIVTVTIDGQSQSVTSVVPLLPFTLPSNDEVTFMCSWIWSGSLGEDVVIMVKTSQGYEAALTHTVP